jgi:ergothioneine biosynthesis protein EgtB
VFLTDFSIASRLVTNEEYLEFMNEGGYRNPALWLSEGWNCIEKHRWEAPLYWEKIGNQWWNMTLSGMQPVSLLDPVCHVSFFEADAFCRWKNAKLASEEEWEIAASELAIEGNFVESNLLHPTASDATFQRSSHIQQSFGDVWEWTSSPYRPYPGFTPPPGAMGEYNGKFMCNQMVLRGGSCVTPQSHMRLTYRNFFSPEARWQFAGFRLAKGPSLHESA